MPVEGLLFVQRLPPKFPDRGLRRPFKDESLEIELADVRTGLVFFQLVRQGERLRCLYRKGVYPICIFADYRDRACALLAMYLFEIHLTTELTVSADFSRLRQ